MIIKKLTITITKMILITRISLIHMMDVELCTVFVAHVVKRSRGSTDASVSTAVSGVQSYKQEWGGR